MYCNKQVVSPHFLQIVKSLDENNSSLIMNHCIFLMSVCWWSCRFCAAVVAHWLGPVAMFLNQHETGKAVCSQQPCAVWPVTCGSESHNWSREDLLQWPGVRWRHHLLHGVYGWCYHSLSSFSVTASTFDLRVSWQKIKLHYLGAGVWPPTTSINGNRVDSLYSFVYLRRLQSSDNYCNLCRHQSTYWNGVISHILPV